MNFWRKYHSDIDSNDPRYNQLTLIYAIALLMVLYFGAIGLLNITLFDAAYIAVYDFIGFVIATSIFLYVYRGGNLAVAGWALVLTLITILLAFIDLSEAENYSLVWVTILPPISFFLLGSRAATILTGLVFIYCGWYLYQLLQIGVPGHLGLGALFNFAEVGLAHILLFRFYERSRQRAYDKLRKLSITDRLTGVYNRLHLDNNLKQMVALAHRTQQPVSVLLLDVDHFKNINDSHGHLMGDAVLVHLASLLKNLSRNTDLLGRWGGEEFLLLCPNTEASAALYLAQRIIKALQKEHTYRGANQQQVTVAVTASIGVATYHPQQPFVVPAAISEQAATSSIPTDNDTVVTPEVAVAISEKLLYIADKHLYQAKEAGRNRAIG
ncbi:GGDEF domain-containing protein [Pseudidiomarina sp. GXY010]|uniref:diguanylate cyclase n=1 Tax=Pseudidiomarina fusca TaxID=2965078 RepID=A0ABU3KZU7_9GAMM|nr:GGDEF domain-containing protein [Pseudidiomarina sp. GXY010]MDT7526411.1 GGDEF domain-containing protein [Pseudidiomarina sp. GXY010]